MRTIIITGANSGLGFETAKKIAKDKNYQVILACRNLEKANIAKDEIIEFSGNKNILVLELDTSSLDSVRNFAKEIKNKKLKIYGLINNAGINGMKNGTSVDNLDLVMATNYIGHFLLTNLLLPEMEDAAKIFNVTSDMHNPPRGIEWLDPNEQFKPLMNKQSYSYSKLDSIYFTYELNEILRNKNSNILVNAFNPGMMETHFLGDKKPPTKMIKFIMPKRVGDLDKSSSALAELITNYDYKDTGKYYDRSTNYINSSELSYNVENRKDLWNKSLLITGLENSKN